ncbi:hypothetical protein AMJ47_01300 [Parcubacteria bacterium DG_72]|nr:MAG: hypothetical protein AMJ47_01300 [Parcubacteria bacterium DG_72]
MKIKDKNNSIKDLRNRDFSEYCEYVVAFELQRLGWKVFQPLVDRYIDIVVFRKKGIENVFRTIQVKGSRVESSEGEDPESYGLTHQPKDLLHDPRHFFIWLFVDNKNNHNFFILSISDFIDIRWGLLPESKRRKNPSLLMRGEWRWGTDRMHPKHWIDNKTDRYKKISKSWKLTKDIRSPSWTLENAVLDPFLNNWNKLEQVAKYSNALKCIKAQEINEAWRGIDRLKAWRENNKNALTIIKKNPKVYKSVTRLDELGIEE